MSVAQQFLKELKEGNTVAAIEAIKEGLRQDAYQKIEEARQEILESYGFVLSEKKKNVDQLEAGDSILLGSDDTPHRVTAVKKMDTDGVGTYYKVTYKTPDGKEKSEPMSGQVKMNESLNEQTFYAIKDTKTNKVISTHDNETDAKDEAEGLGDGVKVVKTKKAPKGWSMKEAKEDQGDE